MISVGRKRAYLRWRQQLTWLRLRYTDAANARRAICLLSRADVLGRVGLHYRCVDEIAQLFIGIPTTQVAVVTRVAHDFGLLLTSVEAISIDAQRSLAVAQLPWAQSTFTAQIVAGQAFCQSHSGKGVWLPTTNASVSPKWQLPRQPPVGMSAWACWEAWGRADDVIGVDAGTLYLRSGNSADLNASPDLATDWPLGQTLDDRHLFAKGNINLYGRREAVRDWLTTQLTQVLTTNPTRLVVIDGVGDLVPQLKRKSALTNLFGEQIQYVNIDGGTQQRGFNPLAALPDEPSTSVFRRWHNWFAAMNVHPSSLALLTAAQQAGVTDLLTLDLWLKGQEKRGAVAAVASLRMTIQRLLTPKVIREWLEWPTNLYTNLKDGSLLFGCRSADAQGDMSQWSRQQLLHAVLLAAQAQPNCRIVLHGFPWILSKRIALSSQQRLLIVNGPQQAQRVIVLTENHVQGLQTLTQRFVPDALWLQENLALLQRGQSVVLTNSGAIFTHWTPQSAIRSDRQE